MKKRCLLTASILVLSIGLVFAAGAKESAKASGDITLRMSWWGGVIPDILRHWRR